jgi:hypothetical protein
MPIQPSEEQQNVIQSIQEGNNVIVDSVAGSGKTTTILFTSAMLPQKRILVVTYNSRLKAETRERVRKNNIQNLEVHSYHSLGLQYYINPCNTDTHLMNILRKSLRPKGRLSFDLVILDECQDMRKDYYFFMRKVLSDMKNEKLQLLVMGDHMQCVYGFLNADPRYLGLADRIFPSKLPWERCSLKTSYRITKPMEWFLNDVVLGYPRMKSVKESSIPVKYYTGDPFFKVPQALAQEIQMLLSTGMKPSDIFVLAPSIKTQNPWNPVKKFENMLVNMGIPCFVPTSDEEALKDEVIHGKIVFSTFHQSKGLERKIVIVMSFSTAYYFVFKEDAKEICPNLVYVASTRASQTLYLWAEAEGESALPFLNHSLLKNNKNFERVHIPSKSTKKTLEETKKEYDRQRLLNVTQLTRFLPEETLSQIVELCNVVVKKKPTKSIEIPSVISTTGDRKENVSDLNGIAIPTIFEFQTKGYTSIQFDLEKFFIPSLRDLGEKITEQQKEWIRIIQNDPSSPSDFVKLANIYSSYISGYIFKIVQIKKYDWLTDEHVKPLLHVLESNVQGDRGNMDFEETLELPGYKFKNEQVQIQGRADLIDDMNLWELKCVDSLKSEHIAQLALYAFLWQETEYKTRGRRRFCLLNIRTGEVLEITGIENLKMIMDLVLDNAFRVSPSLSDDEFVEMCLRGPELTKHLPNTSVEEACFIDDE